MSATAHAPKQIDPSASLHAESLGRAKSHGRLAGRPHHRGRGWQRKIVNAHTLFLDGGHMAGIVRG